MQELGRFAPRCGLCELVVRPLLHPTVLGQPESLAVATRLAAEIANPRPDQRLDQRPASTGRSGPRPRGLTPTLLQGHHGPARSAEDGACSPWADTMRLVG